MAPTQDRLVNILPGQDPTETIYYQPEINKSTTNTSCNEVMKSYNMQIWDDKSFLNVEL